MKSILVETKEYVMENWILIAIGLILMKKAMEYAFALRGGIGIGGELAILAILLLAVEIGKGLYWSLIDILEMEDDEE